MPVSSFLHPRAEGARWIRGNNKRATSLLAMRGAIGKKTEPLHEHHSREALSSRFTGVAEPNRLRRCLPFCILKRQRGCFHLNPESLF
jgi:hypothetical protein